MTQLGNVKIFIQKITKISKKTITKKYKLLTYLQGGVFRLMHSLTIEVN